MHEWTRDPTKGAAAARLVFIAPIERQQLPERSCPSAAPIPAASGIAAPPGYASESARFTARHYPAGVAAHVVADVYAPLAGEVHARQAQKLLQAERLLQFLVAMQRERVDVARLLRVVQDERVEHERRRCVVA